MAHETRMMDKGVYWRFYGRLSFDEILQANSEVWSRPNWDSMAFQIVDLLAVEDADLNTYDITAVSSMDKASARSAGNMRIAMVATDPAIRELCTHYAREMTQPGWDARLFSDLDSARQWAVAGD